MLEFILLLKLLNAELCGLTVIGAKDINTSSSTADYLIIEQNLFQWYSKWCYHRVSAASFMWLASVRRSPAGCCAPDVGPYCVSLSFRGAGRGEPSRRGHRGAGARQVPLCSPQGRHRQGPCLEHCGDFSQMLLPRARSPARRQWPPSRLSFPKGGLPRWVNPLPHLSTTVLQLIRGE